MSRQAQKMSKQHDYSQLNDWKRAFDETIEFYQEAKSTLGLIPAIDYANHPAATGGPSAGGYMKPTVVEYVADVELAARRVLSPELHLVFKALFVTSFEPVDYRSTAVEEIRVRVGRELERVGIHPAPRYFKQKHIDPNKVHRTFTASRTQGRLVGDRAA
jgi:hypothetical protein